jgi:hypothetical protein
MPRRITVSTARELTEVLRGVDLSQIDMLCKADFNGSAGRSMASMHEAAPPARAGWRKLAVLVLAVAAVGLPINHFAAYALLLIATVVIFTGEVRMRPRAWIAAAAVVLIALVGQWLVAPPRIAEGHNVFLPGPADGVLQRGLPAEVYRHMADEFDAQYPPAVRCRPGSEGCWQNSSPPRTFAFSADGIFHPTDASRAVTQIDFSDPVWLRLGFINERTYNWYTAAPDVHRADRDRRFWMGLHRWHLAMPWFEMIRLPAAFVGGELCWRGEVLWEGAQEHFAALRGEQCRTIASGDAGRRIFGIAIKPDTLAMHLTPPWRVRLLQFASAALEVAALVAMVVVLIRIQPRRTFVPFILLGLAMLVIAIDDASFLGAVRPFDGGDDGLFYDGVGREILQNVRAGNIYGALEGGEKVFYYGGPGLRYFRALEHVVFGESYLGYLSLVLLLPIATWKLARRFLPAAWAIGLALVFTAIPIGEIFGTTFVDYAKWAARGFADPAAYILFIAGLIPLLGSARAGPGNNFTSAFFAALLFALAIFMKPIIVPATAVMLAGAAIIAIMLRQWRRLAGLCIGFLPVLSMTLHNWVYGHVFVPLSANAAHPDVLVMPPSAYLTALHEAFALDFNGGYLARALTQILHWLSGPAHSYATIPFNAAGVAVLIYVIIHGRGFDPWLRLLAGAALAQHAVAFFYIATPRYHFLAWFLTMLVFAVWLKDIGMIRLQRRTGSASFRRGAKASA